MTGQASSERWRFQRGYRSATVLTSNPSWIPYSPNCTRRISSKTSLTMVRYATVIFAICFGLRSKELRFCNVNDIHINEGTWTVDVLYPKGEGKYGEEREASIHPGAYPFLTRYFVARAKHVKEIGATTRALPRRRPYGRIPC